MKAENLKDRLKITTKAADKLKLIAENANLQSEVERLRHKKLVSQLFYGKVADIIGTEKTKELLKEANEALEETKPKVGQSEQLICEEHYYNKYSGGSCKKCGALDSSEAN